MADTIQIVCWSLDQRCKFRPLPEIEPASIDAARRNLRLAQTYSRASHQEKHGYGVHGDFCVTSITHGARPGGRAAGLTPGIPSDGFVVSDSFAPFGGVEAVTGMCRYCPANTRPLELAQCTGHFDNWTTRSETEIQLQAIISRLGLSGEMAAAFPATTPLWYGLWAVSPVPISSLPLLGILLTEMLAEHRQSRKANTGSGQRWAEEASALIDAIQIARERGIELQVDLSPPGHADFGVLTTFPHCPFCKAEARIKRWQLHYPKEAHTCDVCGTVFSPAATASRRRMGHEDDDLRERLGEEAFERLTRAFLLARGEAEENIAGIIQATAEEQLRQEKIRLGWAEEHRRNDDYVQRHLYQGLAKVTPPPSDFMEGDDEEQRERPAPGDWFAGREFAEVLRRSEALGVRVTSLNHSSTDELKGRCELPESLCCSATATEIFARWRSEGCDEKFSGCFNVPKELLDHDHADN